MLCTTCKRDFMPVQLRAEVDQPAHVQCVDCIKDERHLLEVTLLHTLLEMGHDVSHAKHIINSVKEFSHKKDK